MTTIQWVLVSVHALLIPVVLGILTKYASTPEISDNIEFPEATRVIRAFEYAAMSAERNNWYIRQDTEEYFLDYIEHYVLHKELEKRYRVYKSGASIAYFFSLMSLIAFCIPFYMKLPCETILKIVFGAISIGVYAVFSMFIDCKIFPHYKAEDFYDRRLFKLRFPSQDATRAEAEEYFDTLHLNYVPVLRCQMEAMRDNMSRSKFVNWVLFLILIVAAILFFSI